MDQEFRISTGMKIFYGIMAGFALIAAIFFYKLPSTPYTPDWLWIFPALFLIGSILIVINIFKRVVIINAESITNINVFITREILLSDIKGYRIVRSGVIIEPFTIGKRRFIIGNHNDLADSEVMIKWLKDNFKNLDAIDLENERKLFLQNDEHGKDVAERENKLKRVKQFADVYSGIGIVVSFALLFLNSDITFIFYLVYPLLSFVIVIKSKGLIKFFSNKNNSVLPGVSTGFMVPAFFLLRLSGERYNIFSADHLWFPSLSLGIILFIIAYKTGLQQVDNTIKEARIFMAFVFLIYSFGSAITINCQFDNSIPQLYTAQVLDEHESHGRSTIYYLTLTPWGPRKIVKQVDVGHKFYNSISVGDIVTVSLKKGLLSIPWYRISK